MKKIRIFESSKILKKLLKFQTQIKTLKADFVFEKLIKITPVNISTFVKIEDSLAINKANYFCEKLKNWDFLILKILKFWATLENGMETFKSD